VRRSPSDQRLVIGDQGRGTRDEGRVGTGVRREASGVRAEVFCPPMVRSWSRVIFNHGGVFTCCECGANIRCGENYWYHLAVYPFRETRSARAHLECHEFRMDLARLLDEDVAIGEVNLWVSKNYREYPAKAVMWREILKVKGAKAYGLGEALISAIGGVMEFKEGECISL
jgi:hypothetical protein